MTTTTASATTPTTGASKPTPSLTIRRAGDRGHAQHGWLDSHHTFSFADYYDPRHMGFRALRVINEDRVSPGQGFGTHGHRDMEIISYVLEGALEHKDSMGTGSVIQPGDVQRMSAGTGVRHSEFNGSKTDPVHFLQIWIQPDANGIAPSYAEKRFSDEEKQGRLRLVVSRDGRDGSLGMNADANLYAGRLSKGENVTYDVPAGRHAWIHVVRGQISVDGHALNAGDAAAVSQAGRLTLSGSGAGTETAEVLVFDLA